MEPTVERSDDGMRLAALGGLHDGRNGADRGTVG